MIPVAALAIPSQYGVKTRFWSSTLDLLNWVYMIPTGIFFLVGMYLAADVDVSRAGNISTTKLRLMILFFGLALFYLGAVSWYFDAGSSRLRPELRWLTRYVCLFSGTILVLSAALRSRASLIKDSDYFTKASYDIEIDGRPEITSAQRVNNKQGTADLKSKLDMSD